MLYRLSDIDIFSILVDLLCNANLTVRTTDEKRASSQQTAFRIKPYLISHVLDFV